MDLEIFYLVLGINSKKTGIALKTINEIGFSKIKHIKRVKKKTDQINLVICNQVSPKFDFLFEKLEKKVFENISLSQSDFIFHLKEFGTDESLIEKYLKFIQEFSLSENIDIIRIKQLKQRMVRVNRRVI